MADSLVTVVIPTRNRLGVLRRSVASALAQEGVDLELVVVDEASADGTSDWLASLVDPRVRVVRNAEPKGSGGARNVGVALAQGQFTAFLDDDDWWARDKLAAQLEAIEDAGAGWCCAGAVIVDDDGRILQALKPPAPERAVERLLGANRVPAGASNVVADTELVRRIGGFDARFRHLADWDLWIRLALASPLAVVPRPLVAYRRHAQMQTATLQGLDDELELLERKHESARAALGVALDRRAWSRWAAEVDAAAGRRWKAAGRMLTAPGTGAFEGLAQALAVAVRPSVLERRGRRRIAEIPHEWRVEADAWVRADESAAPPRPEGEAIA